MFLLSSSFPVWGYVVIGVVALIVLGIVMIRVNRHYRINYNLNLFWGGALMCVAIACVAVSVWILKRGAENQIIWFVLIGVGVLLAILTLVFDIKRCGGGKGALAFFIQLVLCVPCLLVILDYFNPKSSYYANHALEDRRVESERRKRRGDGR